MIYFQLYGMTLIALLTDLVYKRFRDQLHEVTATEESITDIKQSIFEDLLEPTKPGEKPRKLIYYTLFRYSSNRQKRWDEVTNYFVKFLGNILVDIGEVSARNLESNISNQQ